MTTRPKKKSVPRSRGRRRDFSSLIDELFDRMTGSFFDSEPNGGGRAWSDGPPAQLSHSPLTKEENSLYAEIVQLGFREASKKYHPDRGGDERKMAAINALRDKVYQIAGVKK